MRGEIVEKIRERLLKCFLDTAILALLERKPMNGYDITVNFTKKFGVVISTSTVYATFYSMERQELIKGRYHRRSRIYELTEEGNKTLADYRVHLEEVSRFTKVLFYN